MENTAKKQQKTIIKRNGGIQAVWAIMWARKSIYTS